MTETGRYDLLSTASFAVYQVNVAANAPLDYSSATDKTMVSYHLNNGKARTISISNPFQGVSRDRQSHY